MKLLHNATTAMVFTLSIYFIVACSNQPQDPVSGKASNTPELGRLELASTNLATGRTAHTATLLTDGRVLVAGGSTDSRAEILDQNGVNPQFTGALATNRLSHSAVLLQNGKVWVVGGVEGVSNYLASTELYDPSAGTFSTGPSLTVARKSPTLNLLRDGKVLICGGQSDFSTYLDTCDLYDPTVETVAAVPGSMHHARAGHTAVLLQDGNVLICGGMQAQNSPVASCDRYNADTNTFTAVQPMNEAMASHTATVLTNNMVLVTGGRSTTAALSNTEIYDPQSDAWFDGGNLLQGRYLHSANLLPDGCVIIAGGYTGTGALASNETFCNIIPSSNEDGFRIDDLIIHSPQMVNQGIDITALLNEQLAVSIANKDLNMLLLPICNNFLDFPYEMRISNGERVGSEYNMNSENSHAFIAVADTEAERRFKSIGDVTVTIPLGNTPDAFLILREADVRGTYLGGFSGLDEGLIMGAVSEVDAAAFIVYQYGSYTVTLADVFNLIGLQPDFTFKDGSKGYIFVLSYVADAAHVTRQ